MKLTIFIGGLSGGGAERVVCNLANYLTEHGHVIEILTMSDEPASYELDKSIKRISLLYHTENYGFIYNSFIRLMRLRKYMKVSDTEEYLVMLPVTIALLLSQKKTTKAPIIVSERCDPAHRPKLFQIFLTHMMKKASGFVFQTEEAKEWYAQYLSNMDYKIIPNSVDISQLGVGCVDSEKRKSIVGVGRLTGQKRFDLLIKAFAKVHNLHKDYQLTIYGEGELRSELEEMICRLKLDDYVFLPGYINNVAEKLASASIFVLSSDFEGMPNALIEAMALGLPCIATDCPVNGPRSLIEDGVNGILINTGDEDLLVKAILCLIEDKYLAEKIGENAMKIRYVLSPEIIY